MSKISITVDQDTSTFLPHDVISGIIEWEPRGSRPIEVNLLYSTSGRGTQHVELVESIEIPVDVGSANFSFPLPNHPQSFSGELISLTWCLEAINPNAKDSKRYEFVLSDHGKPIELTKG